MTQARQEETPASWEKTPVSKEHILASQEKLLGSQEENPGSLLPWLQKAVLVTTLQVGVVSVVIGCFVLGLLIIIHRTLFFHCQSEVAEVKCDYFVQAEHQ